MKANWWKSKVLCLNLSCNNEIIPPTKQFCSHRHVNSQHGGWKAKVQSAPPSVDRGLGAFWGTAGALGSSAESLRVLVTFASWMFYPHNRITSKDRSLASQWWRRLYTRIQGSHRHQSHVVPSDTSFSLTGTAWGPTPSNSVCFTWGGKLDSYTLFHLYVYVNSFFFLESRCYLSF